MFQLELKLFIQVLENFVDPFLYHNFYKPLWSCEFLQKWVKTLLYILLHDLVVLLFSEVDNDNCKSIACMFCYNIYLSFFGWWTLYHSKYISFAFSFVFICKDVMKKFGTFSQMHTYVHNGYFMSNFSKFGKIWQEW